MSGTTAIIIDYKSARSIKGTHTAQVQDYMKIVQELYPEKMIRGYLIYLDSLEIEAVK